MKELQVIFRNPVGVELTFSSMIPVTNPTPQYVGDALKALGSSVQRNLNLADDPTFSIAHVRLKETHDETQ